MSYIQLFVLSVPAGKKEAYLAFSAKAAALLQEFGATRIVQCWGDDVPDGKITDFRRAVKAEEGEVIGFGWHEYPSKAVRDTVFKKMMEDPRRQELGKSPFDGKRMILGGFEALLDIGQS